MPQNLSNNMDKKNFSQKLTYLPARISKKKDRWEIIYYQTDPSGVRKRHRETWDLNRIKDTKERNAAAKRAVEKINSLLPHNYPHVPLLAIERKINGTTLSQAIKKAMDIKLKSDRYETTKDVNSIGGVLLAWINKNKLDSIPVEDFTRKMALEYLDYVATRKTRKGKPISNRTWNNYRNKTGSLFILLIEREEIKENPFAKIKRKKVAPKHRRKFTPEERALVANWLFKNDYYCLLAVTLQYYGLFRGTELRRMHASDFNLKKGVIFLKGEDSKTNKDRWVTIPETLLTVLLDERFTSIPQNYLVFGKEGVPHPSKPLGRSYMWRHLRNCLVDLQRQGKIKDIDGLSPYSMKDTGITEWLTSISLSDVMRQAGHTNPSTTMIYFQPDPVNEAFKNLSTSIFDANTAPDQAALSVPVQAE